VEIRDGLPAGLLLEDGVVELFVRTPDLYVRGDGGLVPCDETVRDAIWKAAK